MTLSAEHTLTAELGAKADRHLWGHFARHGRGITPPIIARGEGVHIWDSTGKRYIDGLSGLFTCQVGHGRRELAEAAAKQAQTLEFFPLWSYATEPAIELAERLARMTELDQVFFCNSGAESVEAAIKLARRHGGEVGGPDKHEIVCLEGAFHGRTFAALQAT